MTGINTSIPLENGRFSFSKDSAKSSDAIRFYLTFDRHRPYCSRFGANLLNLLQKPVGYVIMNQTVLLETIRKGVAEFVPSSTVEDMDVLTDRDRKGMHLFLTYSTVNENSQTTMEALFV